MLNHQEMLNFIHQNRFNIKDTKMIALKKVNDKKSKELFKEFSDKSEIYLRGTYEYIKSYDGIRHDKMPYYGITYYDPKNHNPYIKIKNSKGILKYSVLVHELTHVKLHKRNPICTSNLSEVVPILEELKFLDYVSSNNLQREAYNIKIKMLKDVSEVAKYAYEDYYTYPMISKDKNDLNKTILEEKYKMILGFLLAINFYNLSLNDKKKYLKDLKYFINNIEFISDDELLKNIDVDINSNLKENVIKNCKNLDNEKKKILRGHC